MNVNETNPVPVEETEPAEIIETLDNSIRSVEISITTSAKEADEATKLEYSASDIEKCTIEKVAVVEEGEPAKDFKISTNTGMKKYLRCQGPLGPQEGTDEEGKGGLQPKNLLNAQNPEKSVSAMRAADIFIST